MKAELVPIEKLLPDPNNPRRELAESQKAELAASLKLHGVKVPLIGFVSANGVIVGDGHCRLEAAKSIGLKELPVIVFTKKPDEAELLATQLTINGHRHALNPLDEYEAFSRLMKLKSWSATELAAGLCVGAAEVTRVLAIGKLSADERQLVREGKLSKSAAYALSRMPSDQRATFARKAAAGDVATRDQLNSQVRKKPKADEAKVRRVTCRIPGGSVSVQSTTGLNLLGLIELFENLVRECKKANSLGVDITTATRMFRDRNQTPAASS